MPAGLIGNISQVRICVSDESTSRTPNTRPYVTAEFV